MPPVGNLSLEDKDINGYTWIVWECTPTNELRGRPKCKSPHCYEWSVRQSKFNKHDMLNKKMKNPGRMQMICKCGNRPRKSVGELKFFACQFTAQCNADELTEMSVHRVFGDEEE
jgi:hypothetical protein